MDALTMRLINLFIAMFSFFLLFLLLITAGPFQTNKTIWSISLQLHTDYYSHYFSPTTYVIDLLLQCPLPGHLAQTFPALLGQMF